MNISRFIRFANEYLKMDQTYFFIYNQCYPVEDLPVNIVPIPYGDDYADPLSRYHYSQQILPFCGRQEELAQLQEFICASKI